MDYYEYKGLCIERGFYGGDEVSVQYCGDDYVFATDADARAFIDSLDELQDEA